MFRKFVMMFAAAAFVTGTVGVAGATTTLKIGTIVPQDSSWGKEFQRLTKDVSDDTNGELVLDFQWNAQAGDENLMVQKIRSGQLDAAAVTALGLAQTGVTDILLFDLPGLFPNWAKLDSVRDAMKDELGKHVREQGLHRSRLGRRRRRQADERRLRDSPSGGSAGQGRLLLHRRPGLAEALLGHRRHHARSSCRSTRCSRRSPAARST